MRNMVLESMLPLISPWFKAFLLVALASLIGFGMMQAEPPPEVAPQSGFQAPDFTLPVVDGESITLSDLRGRPVVINFWASWCAPCRAEMPALQRTASRYEEAGLVILLINQGEDRRAIERYLEEVEVTLPILQDETLDVSRLYRGRVLPTTFFIRPDGIIDEIVMGPMSESYLQSQVQQLLGEP